MKRREPLGLDLTPIIDVVFILLLFFIVSSVFKKDELGNFIFDSNQNKILANYQRYLPDLSDSSTWIAIIFVFVGIFIVLSLAWYGKKKNKQHA